MKYETDGTLSMNVPLGWNAVLRNVSYIQSHNSLLMLRGAPKKISKDYVESTCAYTLWTNRTLLNPILKAVEHTVDVRYSNTVNEFL